MSPWTPEKRQEISSALFLPGDLYFDTRHCGPALVLDVTLVSCGGHSHFVKYKVFVLGGEIDSLFVFGDTLEKMQYKHEEWRLLSRP